MNYLQCLFSIRSLVEQMVCCICDRYLFLLKIPVISGIHCSGISTCICCLCDNIAKGLDLPTIVQDRTPESLLKEYIYLVESSFIFTAVLLASYFSISSAKGGLRTSSHHFIPNDTQRARATATGNQQLLRSCEIQSYYRGFRQRNLRTTDGHIVSYRLFLSIQI